VLTQVLINALFSASVYCLVALGLMLILGVMDIADFAQGGLYMVGAYVAYLVISVGGWGFVAGIAAAVCATVLIGAVNNLLVYRPVTERGASSLIAALGVLLVIQNVAILVFGRDFQTYQAPFGREVISLGAGTVSVYKATVIGAAVILVPLVWYFLARTRTGKAIRAVSQEKEGAAIVGISRTKVSVVTFAIGSAVIGLAGALVSPIYAFDTFFGVDTIVKAFTIVIVGGLGSLAGMLAGVAMIALGENLVAAYLSTEYSSLVTFGLLIAILFSRPQGLFGTKDA
jgi:branched-chain amino acid transport system permease protein